MPRAQTSNVIDRLGALSLFAVAASTLLSPFLAATLPALDPVARQRAWLSSVGARLSFLPGFMASALRAQGPLASGTGFIVGYALPLLISTLCCSALLLALYRRRDELVEADARRALRWAIAFAVVALPAFNVLTQDIWLSVAWGRMLDHGMNPFARAYPLALAADLPLEYDPMPMTYGPAWALVCGLVVAMTGGAALAAWLLFKVVLCCAFIACVWCVAQIARPFGPFRAAFAVVVVGWLPAGMHCGVSEGHIDVVMAAAMLFWLRGVQRSSSGGPLLLTLSILTKYVTAPLALVDVVYHWRARELSVRRYVRRVVPAALLLFAGAAVVALSMGGLSQTSAMRDWKFLDPADVLRLIERYAGIPIGHAGVAISAAVFGAVLLIELLRLARTPGFEAVVCAALATMALVLFAVTGHVWPWFFVWCLPLAALAPDFWLSSFVIGAASIAPFTTMHWTRFAPTGATRSEWPSLVMYGGALIVTLAVAQARARIAVTATRPRGPDSEDETAKAPQDTSGKELESSAAP